MAYTKVYWRPSQISSGALIVLAMISLAGMVMVETMRRQDTKADYGKMAAAAQQTEQAMEFLGDRRRRIQRVDADVDPQESGLIGLASSPVTSLSGHLPAKQTTINPNWAAVIFRMLREAGVSEGEVVAVAVSGSFPALNIATYAAIEQLGARPVVILSGSASQWGANVPGLTWVDMSRELRKAGFTKIHEVAASLGGAQDRGIGISERGREIIRGAIERSELQLLLPSSLDEAVTKRIGIYSRFAEGQPIRAYINIGGGSASTGPASIDQYFESGVIRSAQPKAFAVESVMGHFLKEDVPVLNISGIATLARRYGLPVAPKMEQAIGSGGVYNTVSYRRWLAAFWVVLILLLTYFTTRISGFASSFDKSSNTGGGVRPSI